MSVSGIGGNVPPGYTPPVAHRGPDGTWTTERTPQMNEQIKTSQRQASSRFDADTFVKLLVAQLKYQDPSKPMDSGEMMQQTSMLAMVERVNEMAQATADLQAASKAMAESNAALARTNESMSASYAQMLSSQRTSTAVGLVGKEITFATPATGGTPEKTGRGLVESVKFGQSGPILVVGDTEVPLSDVTAVTPGKPTSA